MSNPSSTTAVNPLDQRRAGILLHPTSLPGSPGNGDLGSNAYWFVDFLAKTGISIWQTLPLAPPHGDRSPYQAKSVHAGNPLLICLDLLQKQNKLPPSNSEPPKEEKAAVAYRMARIHQAFQHHQAHATLQERREFAHFVKQNKWWVDDYALFCTLKVFYDQVAWWQWPEGARDRDPTVLLELAENQADLVEQYRFEQFLFFQQWAALKQYANERGVYLFGDLPIFVAADSVDVWAGRKNFLLDETGHPSVVAGVPPDYFSATGQLWGNPHYDWKYMRKNDFRWWKSRLRTQGELFDVVRIDHFRGFEAYWEVDAKEKTAMNGRWVKAPGEALFDTLHAQNTVPLVAEDLGVITDEVTALREKYAIPGMRILQFAFDSGPTNPYLPHNYQANTVVYTGTHDNDTTVGWFTSLPEGLQHHVCDYLGCTPSEMPWPMIRAAFASVAKLAIIPMQDVIGLGGEHRMNRPGVPDGNWQWRFTWDQVNDEMAQRLRMQVTLYGRLG